MSHNTLAPYPTEVLEAAGILLRKVRGQDVSIAEAVHAAYQVVGVGLGTTLPDVEPNLFTTASMLPSAVADAGECERVLAECCGEFGVKGFLDEAFAKKLLAIAMQLLLRYLSGGI